MGILLNDCLFGCWICSSRAESKIGYGFLWVVQLGLVSLF
jgi:hypothetical protein